MLGVHERGLDGLQRDERGVDALGTVEADLEGAEGAGGVVEGALDAGLELARVQVGADRDPLGRLALGLRRR